MTDVILIVPPYDYKSLKNVGIVCPNLGISYIASLLEKNNFSVKIIDAFALNMEIKDILKIVLKENPKIVGITSVTSNFDIALDVLKYIKKYNPGIYTIYGGPHATFNGIDTLKNFNFIDYIVVGEGEYTTLELVSHLVRNRKSISKIKGMIYKNNKKINVTRPRQLIKNLDVLPFPAYHLLPMDSYKSSPYLETGRKFCSIMTSRGCNYNCIFCLVPKLWGECRSRSVKNICDEITLLHVKYKVSHLYFKDDEFTINRKNVLGICDYIIKNKMDLVWECLGRVNDVDSFLLKKMSKAGCKVLSYGVETGYEEGLKLIRKGITLNMVRKAVKLTKKYGIMALCSFILGFPWENSCEIKKTIKFAKSINSDITYFHLLVPYVGSDIYEIIKEKKLFLNNLNIENYAVHGKNPVIRTEFITDKELRYWRGRAYIETYFNSMFYNKNAYSKLTIGKIRGGLDIFLTSFKDIFNI